MNTTTLSATEFNTIPKRVSHAFGKDVYLLGRLSDANGRELIWLEAPSWDCDWYWGFGYLEVYTNQSQPKLSIDISMHTHWDIQIKNDLTNFAKTCFTEEEGKELCYLFTQFYTIRKEADAAHRTDTDKWDNLNKIQIPAITAKILAILTPKGKNVATT